MRGLGPAQLSQTYDGESQITAVRCLLVLANQISKSERGESLHQKHVMFED